MGSTYTLTGHMMGKVSLICISLLAYIYGIVKACRLQGMFVFF